MRKTSRNRKGILGRNGLLIVAGAAVIVLGLWELDRADVLNLPFLSDDEEAQTTSDGSGINYGPATEQEKQETEDFKEQQASKVDNPPPPPPPAGQKKTVTPLLTSWGQNQSSSALEATGYVSGVVETGGTCTLTATKGSAEVSESIAATPNAQNVSCGLISIPRSKLSAGTWSLVLSYSSASAAGNSDPRNQEVK